MWIAAAMTAVLLSGCSGGGERHESGLQEFRTAPPSIVAVADSDSVAAVVVPPMTSQGVGPVRLGMDVRSLPARLAGVYDTIMTEQMVDDDVMFLSLRFVRGDSVVMVGEADQAEDRSRIVSLAVVSSGPSVNIGGVHVGVGTRRSAMLGLRGLREGVDDRGDFLEWRGVTLYVDDDTVAAMSIVSAASEVVAQ